MENYTIDNPLIIYNPYGTGSLSYYIYYTSDEDSQLSYRISTDGYDYFERNLIDDYFLEKEFQLIGFVPGEVNELTLRETNKNNEVLEKTYEIKTPKLNEDIDTQLEVTDGDAEAELSDGLYTVLGHDKNYASNIYVYDNSGVLREEFVLMDTELTGLYSMMGICIILIRSEELSRLIIWERLLNFTI